MNINIVCLYSRYIAYYCLLLLSSKKYRNNINKSVKIKLNL